VERGGEDDHDAFTPGCCLFVSCFFETSLLACVCFSCLVMLLYSPIFLFFSPLQKQGNKLLSSSFFDDLN
jgi:hypothetical protein